MILSMAHAQVDDASDANVFGAWSNLVVGERPNGLLNCYLVRAEDEIRVLAFWASEEDHDRALGDEMNHPAYALFEAAGLDASHAVLSVEGHLG
jgi:hypothetical protein